MSKPKIFRLIQSYQQWIQDYIDQGWRPYQVSFMFHQLPGSQLSVLAQMKQEICRVYSRLITRFDRNPRSPASFSRLPRLILFPDFPVYKRGKTSIRGISINNGLHYQGIALTPPVSRFRSTLDEHFRQDQHKYINDKLARIAVQPITWDPDYVTDYVAKSIKQGLASDEDIIILPKTIIELPSNVGRFSLSR